MKRVFCILLLASFALSSCILVSSPIRGTIYTDATVQGVIHTPKVDGNMVEGRAMASGILGFVDGDCSYEAALKNALGSSGAKALTNIIVDHEIKNVLGVYVKYTTIVRGVPVR